MFSFYFTQLICLDVVFIYCCCCFFCAKFSWENLCENKTRKREKSGALIRYITLRMHIVSLTIGLWSGDLLYRVSLSLPLFLFLSRSVCFLSSTISPFVCVWAPQHSSQTCSIHFYFRQQLIEFVEKTLISFHLPQTLEKKTHTHNYEQVLLFCNAADRKQRTAWNNCDATKVFRSLHCNFIWIWLTHNSLHSQKLFIRCCYCCSLDKNYRERKKWIFAWQTLETNKKITNGASQRYLAFYHFACDNATKKKEFLFRIEYSVRRAHMWFRVLNCYRCIWFVCTFVVAFLYIHFIPSNFVTSHFDTKTLRFCTKNRDYWVSSCS